VHAHVCFTTLPALSQPACVCLVALSDVRYASTCDIVDIEGGNLKIILGLIWTLILHYQLSRTRKGAKPADAGSATASSASQQLLSYVQGKCTPSGVVAADFADSFRDGRVISALTNSLAPERHLIDLNKLVSATVLNAVYHYYCRVGAIKQPFAPTM